MIAGVRAAFAATGFLCLAGCGTALWTEAPRLDKPSQSYDGAKLSYALAQGQVAFSAELKDNVLTLTTDQKVIASADPLMMLDVVYNHSPFADDDISVQLDGALIKTMSSNSEDKTAAILTNTTALFTQISATQTALRKAASDMTVMMTQKKEEKPSPPCANMEKSLVKNVTYDRGNSYWTHHGTKDCDIAFTVSATLQKNTVMGVSGFDTDDKSDYSLKCKRAVCFRLGGIFTISGYAEVVHPDGKRDMRTQLPSFTVTAPIANQLGYVRFDRRAFVKNKTQIDFGSNGVLTGFQATNPSEVVGFLIIPAGVLAGVAAAAAIN